MKLVSVQSNDNLLAMIWEDESRGFTTELKTFSEHKKAFRIISKPWHKNLSNAIKRVTRWLTQKR